ncbi:hypothetical protein [Mailhella sp.]|uniref:hypothetical protein n=1 Tax=Mailhella sp. TaxID=1981029 RepID=UPI004063A05B
MNKKFIIGGIMFWAGLSGYMGLRVLESYTEDAVYAVLSVIPAQAQEIRYSFLDDSLRLKGVEYEIPDEKVIHKGSIESVEVKKFHRKIMFVKPNMPPYHADELPRVGESFTFTGIADRVHKDNTVIESRIGSMQVEGWYQRVGMVMDRLIRKGAGSEFFEELFRTRVDGLRAEQIDVSISAPSLDSPVKMHIDSATLPAGIRAPRGTELNTPVDAVLERVSIRQGDQSASASRMELRALRAPEPEQLARLVELSRALREGKAEAASDSLGSMLVGGYAKYPPFSLFSLYGVNVKTGKDEPPVTAKSFSYALRYQGDGYADSMKCTDLHVRPESFGELSAVVSRFAPDGIRLNASNESTCDSRELSARAVYELPDLGRFEGSSAFVGDFVQLKKLSLLGELVSADPLELLDKIQLKKIEMRYADSGLVEIGFAAAAQELGLAPEQLRTEALAAVHAMAGDENTVLAKLGAVLTEQLSAPGEIALELAPKESVSVQKLAKTLLVAPQDFPFTVQSRPGQKLHFEAGEGK